MTDIDDADEELSVGLKRVARSASIFRDAMIENGYTRAEAVWGDTMSEEARPVDGWCELCGRKYTEQDMLLGKDGLALHIGAHNLSLAILAEFRPFLDALSRLVEPKR